jgi:hypothetical protein
MPITIEDDHYEFDLRVGTSAAGKVDAEFNLFLEVKNVLVIYPVKFPIEVLEVETGTENPAQAEQAPPLPLD